MPCSHVQGEVFKADGEVASARPPSSAQQRYLLAVKSAPESAAAQEAPDQTPCGAAADIQQRLDHLAEQERMLKKQVIEKTMPCSRLSGWESLLPRTPQLTLEV